MVSAQASPANLDNAVSTAANGKLPLLENVRFVNVGTLGPASLGAYDPANGGTGSNSGSSSNGALSNSAGG